MKTMSKHEHHVDERRDVDLADARRRCACRSRAPSPAYPRGRPLGRTEATSGIALSNGAVALGDERDPLGGRGLELGHEVADALVDPVVEEDRGDGRGQADGRRDERLADGRGDDGQARGLGRADADERVHDAVHRAEEADERRARRDERQEPHERARALPLGEDRAVGDGAQAIGLGARAARIELGHDARAGRPHRAGELEQFPRRSRVPRAPVEVVLRRSQARRAAAS